MPIMIETHDLANMPEELRNKLLDWYRDKPVAVGSKTTPQSQPQQGTSSPFTLNRQVTFSELVNAGLLHDGDEVLCRTLTRQRRQGQGGYITGSRVAADGSVEFKGQKFYKPSKLAVAMVNSTIRSADPKQRAKALNGYDYLFAKTSSGLASLDELRKKLLAATP